MKYVNKFKEFFGMIPPEEGEYDDDYVDDPGYAYPDNEKYGDYSYGEDYRPGATPLPPLHQPGRYEEAQSRYAPREAKQITTVSPQSYAEAELVGKRFREGNPVVVDLSRLDTDLGQRLIDFSSGLVYAMDGSLERIARKVFLLSPAETVVNEEERRRIEDNYGS